MIGKYFTTTLRHLWRYRLFTGLNILGLAFAISACWIIFRIVSFEFSYDKQLVDKNNVYRVISGFVFDDKEQYNGGVSKPIYQGIKEQVSGVDYVVPVFGIWMKSVQINNTGNAPFMLKDHENSIVATDSNYFAMLPYKWVIGNRLTALQAPESVVLTESRAKKYFPGKSFRDIIHQTITYYSLRDTVQRMVTGIVADYAAPTEFTAQEFCPLPKKAYELAAWTNTNGSDRLYLQLKHGADPAKIAIQIDSLTAKKRRVFQPGSVEDFKHRQRYELMPLKESHFSVYIQEFDVRKANKRVLYGLESIALFLLIIACINYINISVASMPQRAKEIGVRKTLGSSQFQLVGQFLIETLCITTLATLLSFLFSSLGFGILKDIIPPGITPFTDAKQLLAFIVVLSAAITILAGLYPGWLVTRVKTIHVFRGSYFTAKDGSRFSLQKALIVFQFVIALGFITCSIIIARQLHYMLTADVGFNKNGIVLVDVPWKLRWEKKYDGKQFPLLNELQKNAGIEDVALGEAPMNNGYSSGQYEYVQEGKEPISRQVNRKVVDTAYIGLFGIKLLAGRNLQPSDTTNEYVINETAVRAFGFASPNDAIGKFISPTRGVKFPIVGVVKDFHVEGFYKEINPMLLQSEKSDLTSFNIKLGQNPQQWQQTLKQIEKKWYEFFPPETFSYQFYDESIEAMYKEEQHLAKLINLATGISIFISCLGLFGLAVLSIFQRTKEIGIRKVLGASVATIVKLLTKEYVFLVMLGLLIASPVAWWAMHKWLQHFAYRITLQWWIFALTGFIAVVIAMATVGFHAMRAAVANPVKSLRTE